MLQQIVGFRIPLEKIEGKWKLNQNHPVEGRKKVVDILRQREGENARALAGVMETMLPTDS
jgi:transcriptional regulator